MDNIRATIDLLFSRRGCEDILDSVFEKRNNVASADKKVEEVWFCRAFVNDNNIYSNDQVSGIYRILTDKWMEFGDCSEKSVFNVLHQFTDKVLKIVDSEPVCRYEHLLRWHALSLKVGEDMLCTSFMAYKDYFTPRPVHRTFFGWQPCIESDNKQLNHILNKGIAELHLHLKGSSLNFELNWLALMNNILDRRKAFKNLEKRQRPDVDIFDSAKKESLYALCIKASAIRALIWEFIYDGSTETTDEILCIKELPELMLHTNRLQRKINILRYRYGHRYYGSVVDYAIPQNLPEAYCNPQLYLAGSILSGERQLMYTCFYRIFARDSKFQNLVPLFYAYLAAKSKLRQELVQTNSGMGFSNFQQYDKRKVLFIRENSIYEKLIASMAINGSKHSDKDYIEARITPKVSPQELSKSINTYDRQIKKFSQTPPSYLHHYILHFIKRKDSNNLRNIVGQTLMRNYNVRTQIRQEAFAINNIRQNINIAGSRIVGIDAAGSELFCRPEVFAQVFRYLKNYHRPHNYDYLKYHPIQPLGVTYHVGEDYMDMADGLRAIEEALLFLNLGNGDRLGHALSLGKDAAKYYTLENRTIVISKQDLLDNVVWLSMKISNYGLQVNNALVSEFKCLYENLYREIYEEDSPTMYTYYQSWLLRGDDPEQYKHSEHTLCNEKQITYWRQYSLSESEKVKEARKNDDARKLFYRYHYDFNVRQKGHPFTEFKIPGDYEFLITQLQQAMRGDIAKRHICIETNLSSNKVIGALSRYDAHPIVKFYDYGLSYANDSKCFQIPVSINSDDSGVFCTMTRREYSLMALSMEKVVDNEGKHLYIPQSIYQWLDNIRESAFAQKFKTDDH